MNIMLVRILKFLLLASLLLFPLIGSSFYLELVARSVIFGIFAISLDLLVGYTGLVSLGHAAYFGTAAYALALMAPKYEAANFWFVTPAAIGIASATAMVVGLFALRTRGVYFIMVTLAFAQMTFYLFHDTWLGGGSDGIYLNLKPEAIVGENKVFDLDQPLHLYYLIVLCLILVYLFLEQILRSNFGSVLVGIRSNEHRMKSLGYNTFAYKLAAFTIAGGLAGVAGSLYAIQSGFITPELLSWHQSANVLLMVILGGMGNLTAVLLGTALFIALQEFLPNLLPHWQLAMGLTIVLIVLFLPGGLAATPKRIRSLLLGGEAR